MWHILEILEGSPAQSAGLVPYGDFIIGWPSGALRSESDFYELIENHVDKALRLYVYNSDYDHTREVIIVPNREWGGEGLLGCGVGYGLLHRIPKPSEETRAQASDLDLDDSADVRGGLSNGVASNTPRIGGTSGTMDDVDATPKQQPPRGANQSSQATPRRHHESIAEVEEEDEDANASHDQGVTVSMRQEEEEEDDEVL